jgi:hypothetical protein
MATAPKITFATPNAPPPTPRRIAWINEPNVPECRPNERWFVRLITRAANGRSQIEIGYISRVDERKNLRIDAGRRAEAEWVRKELDSLNARIPKDRKRALLFAQALMRAIPAHPVTAYDSPSYCDEARGFIMPYRKYGTADERQAWDTAHAPKRVGKISGDLQSYSKSVLEAALWSPYLTLAILLGLAGCLNAYVLARTRRRLLSETAIVHFAGETSTGKTTLERVCQSVFGSPDIETDFDATDRGIAEQAHARDNLALVIDDSESAGDDDHQIWSKFQRLAQRLPSGRSRSIAQRSMNSDLPRMSWCCFGVTSGPHTVAAVAGRLKKKLQGERARIFDIEVPNRSAGGIFGSEVTAAAGPAPSSKQLIEAIETTILSHHGVLFDAWMQHLMENDVAHGVFGLRDEFVAETARGADFLESRVAEKYGAMVAAGAIGVKGGLLPWPQDWPMRAVRFCYEGSVCARDPDSAKIERAMRALAKAVRSRALFPIFDPKKDYPNWSEEMMGLRRLVEDGQHWRAFLAKDHLSLLEELDYGRGDAMFDKLRNMGFMDEESIQLRVQGASKIDDSRRTREFTLSLNRKGRFLSVAEIGDNEQYHDFHQCSALIIEAAPVYQR